MEHFRSTRPLWRIGAASRRAGQVSRRRYVNEQHSTTTPPQPTPPHTPASPPNPNSSKPPSKVGAYYKTFSYPILKSFLVALFTYQITYYAWLKLETIDEKHAKAIELSDLQAQLREAIEKQRGKASDAVDELRDKINEYTEDTKEAGRAVVESVREGGEEVGKTADAVRSVARGGWWPW